MKKYLYLICFILILLIPLFSGCTTESTNDSNAEDFEFTLLDGTKKRLSDYRGEYVLVDFFGVNCEPCQYQMLVLTQIYEDYTQIEIISIDVWIALGETPASVEQFVSSAKEYGVYLNWTFGVDDTAGTLFNKYASNGVPMLYLFDKNGNIYYSKAGYTEYSELAGKIDELIS